MLGVKAASQLWEDKPAWYVWLTNSSGNYKIQLTDISVGDENSDILTGYFIIKCYPLVDSEVFSTFSSKERATLNGSFFDHTNTPKFECLNKIPEDFFNVAVLELNFCPNESTACLTLESMTKLRTIIHEDRTIKSDGAQSASIDETDSIDRCVPGWRLGTLLFTRLLSMYAFHSKTKPVRIQAIRSPGFEYFTSNDGSLKYRDAADIDCYTLSVLFSSSQMQNADGDTLSNVFSQKEQDPGVEEILLDRLFFEGHIFPQDKAALSRISNVICVDELWWQLADANYKSELGTTCGCNGDHKHSCGF